VLHRRSGVETERPHYDESDFLAIKTFDEASPQWGLAAFATTGMLAAIGAWDPSEDKVTFRIDFATSDLAQREGGAST
jgi:hypothetical protein